jgi:hypothetical protein
MINVRARVAIFTEELPAGWEWDPLNPVRGTDKFYVKTAESFIERFGLTEGVCVFLDAKSAKFSGNVQYLPRNQFDSSKFDVVLVCNPRKPMLDLMQTNAQIILWTNFAVPKDVFKEWWDFIDGQYYDDFVCISGYAKTLLHPSFRDKFRVIEHGVDRDIYNLGSTLDKPREKIVAFTSSPDRGLLVVKRLVEQCHGWTLKTTPYGGTSSMNDWEVAELLRSAQYWVHPGIGNELFCLAAAEAQCCGAIPIVVPNGALATTVRTGYKLTDSTFQRNFVSILNEVPYVGPIPASETKHIKTWTEIADQFFI